jgi:hypothetical protein
MKRGGALILLGLLLFCLGAWLKWRVAGRVL